MIRSVSNRFAARSLARRPLRTTLSLAGVAIGVAIGLISLGWIRGEETMIIRAAAGSGIGHVRIVPRGWLRSKKLDLRLAHWRADLAAARRAPGVKVATPTAQARALLGLGTRTANVEMTGVDPATEQKAVRLVRQVAKGRYLRPSERGTAVIGKTLAERLRAEIDDELVATVVDKEGEMRTALLRVVGIVDTGSREVDASICHVPLEDVEELTGLTGAATITVLLDDHRRVPQVTKAIATRIDGGDEALTWAQFSPELSAGLAIDQAFMNVTIGIILFVVLLGVASAQLTGVLERRKEFAVLIALGMKGRQLVKLVLAEAVALGLVGSVLGLALATPLVHSLSTTGVDFSELVGGEEGLAMGSVMMDPVFYADFGTWLVPYGLFFGLTATIVAGLYPAWFATRTDPASALRVEQ